LLFIEVFKRPYRFLNRLTAIKRVISSKIKIMEFLGRKIRGINVLFFIALIAADLILIMFLGLLLMGYEDHWDESKGAYWSFKSMTAFEITIYILYNLWYIVNAILILRFIYLFYKRLKAFLTL
jgi:hypothetical protein